MKVVFVKLVEVTGFPPSKPDVHQVYVKLRPTEQGSYGPLVGSQTFRCETVWSFVCEAAEGSAPSFSIWIFEPVRNEVARLTLPLPWFPANSVVTHEYPLRSLFGGMSGWATVQVHLSEEGASAFRADPAGLLVTPAWSKPAAAAHPQRPPPPPPQPYPGYPPFAYPQYPGRPAPVTYGYPGYAPMQVYVLNPAQVQRGGFPAR
jgi:hypothetical protein